MATSWVVADYLVTTEQLSDVIAVKIKNNIQIGTTNCKHVYSAVEVSVCLYLCPGYQRQLNYLQGSGCFSIWPTAKCSSW